jgi:hypothetical protein
LKSAAGLQAARQQGGAVAKTQKSQPAVAAAKDLPNSSARKFEPRPPKKHPVALAVTTLLLVVWLAFLAYLAFRG